MKHMRCEYKVIHPMEAGLPFPGPSAGEWFGRFTEGLNNLGAEGWVMAGVIGEHILIFARPLYGDQQPGSRP